MDIEEIGKKERIAIIDPDKCKPNKCGKQCIKSCPINRQGKICIEIDKTVSKKGMARIAESLCIGCGMCVKVCPFSAIKIVNVPKGLAKDVVHRYGINSFKLHKLPDVKKGQITGILGQNGLGKSTILGILSSKLTMNLGKLNTPSDQVAKEVHRRFRGSNVQKIISGDITCAIKPQNINQLRSNVWPDMDLSGFDLEGLAGRSLDQLSGGELQRLAIATVCKQQADVYLFDEPTSFLDLKQRINIANQIKKHCCKDNTYTVVVDHDISILDYIADQLVILYGERGVFGITATIQPVGQGINNYFEGYLPKDNVRFRKQPFKFEQSQQLDEVRAEHTAPVFSYPDMQWGIGTFSLNITGASYTTHSITALLGQNGGGKTSFVNLIANMATDEETVVSVKEQYIGKQAMKYKNETVQKYLEGSVGALELIRKLDLEPLMGRKLYKLSGGELQKVMIVKCLSEQAEIYLLDEPSAFLDTETRITVAKLIKEWFNGKPVSVFVIDHDILMTCYLADQVILFEGEPGVSMKAGAPVDVKDGMNRYLEQLGITMRLDGSTSRRRINKHGSLKDTEQKSTGQHY